LKQNKKQKRDTGISQNNAGDKVMVLEDGTVYSKRKNFTPFSAPTPEAYAPLVGQGTMERLYKAAEEVKGVKLLELNATAQGGGVAELLYSYIPFLNNVGVEAEWKILHGNEEYFECTKCLHNVLQGSDEAFTDEMEQVYSRTLENCAQAEPIDYDPDVVLVHDPQPMGLNRYLKKPDQVWLWRCHIDIEEEAIEDNPALWDFLTGMTEGYDAAVFTAAHYVVSRWPLPKFIIPPFIDPLSEKNRELSQAEIDQVLNKYQIDPEIPIIAQIGRFDPWKGIDRTIATFHRVKEQEKCQLILAGGLASDDPEGARILAKIIKETKKDNSIHVLELPLENRLENAREVNALQRAARIIMQPSTREGFGLVITEALWKEKPVISANTGAISLQIRDGDTGFFYTTPRGTAQKVIHLLSHPEDAEAVGKRGKEYVKQHFLLPDRVADWLTTIGITLDKGMSRKLYKDCIISFHPWFKLSKRRASSNIH